MQAAHKDAHPAAGETALSLAQSSRAPAGRAGTGAYIMYGLAAVLFAGQFFRGLFFPGDQLVALIVIALIGLLFVAWRGGDLGFKLNVLDWALLGTTLVYLLGPVWGINTRLAVQGGVKALTYFLVYWMVSRTAGHTGSRVWVGRVLGWVGGLGMVAAVLLATGWFGYEDAVMASRLAGGFQYPNTLGGYALLTLFLVLGLRTQDSGTTEGYFWSVFGFSALYDLFLSYSRGGWLVLPVAAVLLLAVAPKGSRTKLFLMATPVVVGFAAVALPANSALLGGRYGLLFVWWLLGSVLAAAVDFGLRRIKGKVTPKALVIAGLIVAAGAAVVIAPQAPHLLSRFQSLLAGDDINTIVRQYNYRDGMKALSDHNWIVGLGGGGWRAANMYYRSWNYVSRQTHSSVVETLTEVGGLGLGLFVAGWIAAAWLYLRRGRKAEAPEVWTGLVVGVIALLAHSFIDFDLTYSAVSLILFACFGLLRALAPVEAGKGLQGGAKVAGATLGVAILGIALVGSTMLRVSMSDYEKAADQVRKGQGTPAVATLEKAERLDPFDSAPRILRAQLLIDGGLKLKNADMKNQGYREFERAKAVDHYNPDVYQMLAAFSAVDGKAEAAVDAQWTAIQMDRYNTVRYEDFFKYALTAVDSALDAGDKAKAGKYLTRMSEGFKYWDEVAGSQPPFTPDFDRMPGTTLNRQVYWAQYLVYSGKFDEARKALEPLSQSQEARIKADALMWLGLMDRLQNQPTGDQRLEQAVQLNPNLKSALPVFFKRLQLATSH